MGTRLTCYCHSKVSELIRPWFYCKVTEYFELYESFALWSQFYSTKLCTVQRLKSNSLPFTQETATCTNTQEKQSIYPESRATDLRNGNPRKRERGGKKINPNDLPHCGGLYTCNWLRESASAAMIVANQSIYITRKTRMRTRAGYSHYWKDPKRETRRRGWKRAPVEAKIALTSGHREPSRATSFLLLLILLPLPRSVSIFKRGYRYLLSRYSLAWIEVVTANLVLMRYSMIS